ncbi:MAG: hypothetical protein ABSE59_07175 [Opitutaceae bacterium]|jgi:hypothetical protein
MKKTPLLAVVVVLALSGAYFGYRSWKAAAGRGSAAPTAVTAPLPQAAAPKPVGLTPPAAAPAGPVAPKVSNLAVVASAQPAGAPIPLVDLVGDDTALAIYITDLPALIKRWPATPWMKTWHDEQVQKYFAPLCAQLKADEWDERCKTATGYTVDGLLGFATGEALVVVPDIGAVIKAAQTKKDPPPFLMAIAIGGHTTQIEKLIADLEAKAKDPLETTETFGGATLHLLREPAGENPPGDRPKGLWTVANGIFYFGSSQDLLEQTLNAAHQGGHDNALGKSDGFMRMRRRVGDAQIYYYANVKAMYPAVQKAIAGHKGAGSPLAVDPTTILPALGLDTVNELYLTLTLGETFTDLNVGLTYNERRGLTRLLAYANGAPPQPRFVPGKSVSVSSARFSLKNFYAAFDDILGNISPFLGGMFDGYVKNFNQRAGIDLQRDLIGNFGDQVVLATSLNDAAPPDAPVNERLSQFYAFSIENATAMTATIESIKRGLLGDGADKLFEMRSYLGHDIYTFSPPQSPSAEGEAPRPAARGFSYAVTDGWFFLGVGSATPIESALQGLDGRQPSFWDKNDVKRNLLADLPDSARGFSYADLSQTMPLGFDVMVQAIETSWKMAAARRAQGGAGPASDPDKALVDDRAKPDAATLGKYWGYSRSYIDQDANGLYSTVRIAYPTTP